MEHSCESFHRVGLPCPRRIQQERRKRRRDKEPETAEDHLPQRFMESVRVREPAATELQRSLGKDVPTEVYWPIIWADAVRQIRRITKSGRRAPGIKERTLAKVMARTVPFRAGVRHPLLAPRATGRGGGGKIPYWQRYGMIRSLRKRKEILFATTELWGGAPSPPDF